MVHRRTEQSGEIHGRRLATLHLSLYQPSTLGGDSEKSEELTMATIQMSRPVATSVADDLTEIARFFGFKHPTGEGMVKLTRTSAPTISRALNGQHVDWKRRDHLGVVAEFAREARDYFYEVDADQWTEEQAHQMQVWLDRDTVKVDGKSYRPVDALSSPELAPKLLSSLRDAS
jgi:hypothetical protein